MIYLFALFVLLAAGALAKAAARQRQGDGQADTTWGLATYSMLCSGGCTLAGSIALAIVMGVGGALEGSMGGILLAIAFVPLAGAFCFTALPLIYVLGKRTVQGKRRLAFFGMLAGAILANLPVLLKSPAYWYGAEFLGLGTLGAGLWLLYLKMFDPPSPEETKP